MYKTGHAVNYLLRKENVANDIIKVSLFAYDEITLITWNVTKKSKQNVWESKKYGLTRLIKEFSNKKWSKRGVEDFLKRRPLNEHPVEDVVNHAIDEWRRRLSACDDAEGRHFEHYLWLLLSK